MWPARDQRGIVTIEFLMAFMPFFILFLGGVQVALLAQAHAVVRHAALRAARTAVITIDDDPHFYDRESRKMLTTSGKPDGQPSPAESAMQAAADGQQAAVIEGQEQTGGNRIKRIRNAAYVPLSVISPTQQQVARWVPFAAWLNPALDDTSLAAVTGDAPLWRIITGFGVYGRIGSAITFPKAPGSEELRDLEQDTFDDKENVTVRVSFLYPCTVPFVRSLVCKSALGMTGIPEQWQKTLDALRDPSFQKVKRTVESWKRWHGEEWKAFKATLKELQHAEWPLVQLFVLAQSDERFLVISHEATLPNHGAAYEYYSEQKKGKP